MSDTDSERESLLETDGEESVHGSADELPDTTKSNEIELEPEDEFPLDEPPDSVRFPQMETHVTAAPRPRMVVEAAVASVVADLMRLLNGTSWPAPWLVTPSVRPWSMDAPLLWQDDSQDWCPMR